MRTRCPYHDCWREFETDFELPKGDWHWKHGLCSVCKRPASLRALEVLHSIDHMYEKRHANGTLSGGRLSKNQPIQVSVIVEDIRSLWNVGSIFRTADGAGITKLFLCGVTGAPPRKELAKTSLGAEETVEWQYCKGAMDVLPDLRRQGTKIIALERNAESQSLTDFLLASALESPLCLVVGNEVTGVSAETLSMCDSVCHLPMRGMKESLNVAVAFGIAAYAITDELVRRQGGLKD